MVCRPRRICSPRRPHHLHLRPVARDPPAPKAARKVRKSTCTTGIWPHAAKVVISVVKRSSIDVVRGATTRSCFRLGIPSGHSSGSHSTARAISFTWHFPAAIGVEGAFKQAKGLVRLCRAEQVKYARLQHRL